MFLWLVDRPADLFSLRMVVAVVPQSYTGRLYVTVELVGQSSKEAAAVAAVVKLKPPGIT